MERRQERRNGFKMTRLKLANMTCGFLIVVALLNNCGGFHQFESEPSSALATTSLIAKPSDAEPITQIYMTVLERFPSADELTRALQSRHDGVTLAEIRHVLALSEEAAANINLRFKKSAARPADIQDIKFWQNNLATGSSLKEMENSLANESQAQANRESKLPEDY